VRKNKKDEFVVKSNSNSKETEVVLYFKNAQASFVKKLQIKIDNKPFHTCQASIPVNQIYCVSGIFPRPSSGEHLINVEIRMPAKGFYDGVTEQFNLSKHGGHILVDVTEEKLEDGSVESGMQFQNQHGIFSFE